MNLQRANLHRANLNQAILSGAVFQPYAASTPFDLCEVAAGFPLQLKTTLRKTRPQSVSDSPSGCYFVRASGDSMVGADHSGDLLIVDRAIGSSKWQCSDRGGEWRTYRQKAF